jgi:hypothetical protein
MFAARWCGDLPELLLARTIMEEKFGTDFAVAAKEDYSKTHKSSINKFVDPMVSDNLFVPVERVGALPPGRLRGDRGRARLRCRSVERGGAAAHRARGAASRPRRRPSRARVRCRPVVRVGAPPRWPRPSPLPPGRARLHLAASRPVQRRRRPVARVAPRCQPSLAGAPPPRSRVPAPRCRLSHLGAPPGMYIHHQ